MPTDSTFSILQVKTPLGRCDFTHKVRRPVFKRIYRLMSFVLLLQFYMHGQPVVYDNFEGNRAVSYIEKSGVLDTVAANPSPDAGNSSKQCALYIRNSSKKFDNIKMKLNANLVDVSSYATYLGEPPKIKMKIYTSAPPGTLVEILLTRRSNNDYPSGTHSQYQAYTSVSNKWENLEFKFSQIPQGSETAATQVDQVVLLFNPNSSTSDTYYFDEISGPGLAEWPAEKIAVPDKDVKKQETAKKEKNSKKISSK